MSRSIIPPKVFLHFLSFFFGAFHFLLRVFTGPSFGSRISGGMASENVSVCPQSLQDEQALSSQSMVNINQQLQDIFGPAIRASFPDLADAPLAITPSQQSKFGDYQCNSAMAIAQVGAPSPPCWCKTASSRSV